MDCGLAQERLDVARPDASDRSNPELREAFAHVEECVPCRGERAARVEFDRRVGAVVRNVAIPAGLHDRLQAALAAPSGPRPLVPDDPSRRATRRTVLKASAVAAGIGVATLIGWRITFRPTALLSFEGVSQWWDAQLLSAGNYDVRSAPAFDGRFDATIQDGRWARLVSGAARGADLDGDGHHDAAVYPLNGGFLVVMPKGEFADPPSAPSALNAAKRYTPHPHVAWSFRDQVYICYSQSGRAWLERVLDRVYGSTA